MLELRQYTPPDSHACLHLFCDTVRQVNAGDYNPHQIAAWASPDIDVDVWGNRFHGRHAYVALANAEIVGFADMTPTGYLDRLFVSAAHQRQGIATALVTQLLSVASRAAIEEVTADVSITAVPFFARMGFSDPVEQSVECRGAWFTNYRMTYRSPNQYR